MTDTPKIYTFRFPHLSIPERKFVLRSTVETVGVRVFAMKHAATITRIKLSEDPEELLLHFSTEGFATDLMRAFLMGNHDGIDWLYDLSPEDFESNVPDIMAALNTMINIYVKPTAPQDEKQEEKQDDGEGSTEATA